MSVLSLLSGHRATTLGVPPGGRKAQAGERATHEAAKRPQSVAARWPQQAGGPRMGCSRQAAQMGQGSRRAHPPAARLPVQRRRG